MTKVMFVVAVARPRYDHQGRMVFDGMIGLWPVIETRTAVQNSKHRRAGAEVIVPVEINRDRYKSILVNSLIPAIKVKWTGNVQL